MSKCTWLCQIIYIQCFLWLNSSICELQNVWIDLIQKQYYKVPITLMHSTYLHFGRFDRVNQLCYLPFWLLLLLFDYYFFLSFIYFTSFGEKDKADMNSLRWSAPVGLEPAYTHMWVARSTTVLRTTTFTRTIKNNFDNDTGDNP